MAPSMRPAGRGDSTRAAKTPDRNARPESPPTGSRPTRPSAATTALPAHRPRGRRIPGVRDDPALPASPRAERERFERERSDPALLFELYADDVYRFCRASGCARADAEDITAEVFAQALGRLARLRWRHRPAVAFLFTLARRRVADHFRRQSREQPSGLAEEWPASATEHDYIRTGAALRSSIAKLAERERVAVILRLVNGYSFAEVATALGSSEKAAKSLVYRALEKLEVALDAEGIER